MLGGRPKFEETKGSECGKVEIGTIWDLEKQTNVKTHDVSILPGDVFELEALIY